MATISCDGFLGGGFMPRVSVNGYQFVECDSFIGGGAMDPVKIDSGIGSGVLIVDSWDPPHDSFNVGHMESFLVQAHADPGITEFTKLYDETTDWDTGTHNDTVAQGAGIQLATISPDVDFEDYTVDTAVTSGVQPDYWLMTSQTSPPYIRDDYGDGNQYAHYDCYNNIFHVLYMDMSPVSRGEVEVMVRADSSGGTGGTYTIFYNCTGSGDAMRGHLVQFAQGGSTAVCRRVYDWNSFSGVGYPLSLGQTMNMDTWYHIKLLTYLYNSDTYVGCRLKFWKDGDSEPVDYTWLYGDNIYAQAGYYGFGMNGSALSPKGSFDNWKVWPDPATYATSGDWESGEIDTTSIVNYSYGTVTWDETIPTDTTAAVKARWDTGGTWLTCTNGGQVPGISVGHAMGAGNTKDSLEFRVEFTTTDTSATPLVENLQFYHEPFANLAAEIRLNDPKISCVESDGSLEIWGKNQISGGAIVTEWDGLFMRTRQPYLLLGQDRQAVAADLYYNDELVEGIVVELQADYWMVAIDTMQGWFSLDPIKTEGAAETRWNAQEPWFPAYHGYDWVLVDYTLGMRADATYLIGHYQLDDSPGSMLAAALELTDNPGEVLVYGYRLNDHVGEGLVQGYRLDAQLGMVMPAVQAMQDQVGSFLSAVLEVRDNPGMVLVYGVASDGAFFVNVIDDDTYQALIDEGITFS